MRDSNLDNLETAQRVQQALLTCMGRDFIINVVSMLQYTSCLEVTVSLQPIKKEESNFENKRV